MRNCHVQRNERTLYLGVFVALLGLKLGEKEFDYRYLEDFRLGEGVTSLFSPISSAASDLGS